MVRSAEVLVQLQSQDAGKEGGYDDGHEGYTEGEFYSAWDQ